MPSKSKLFKDFHNLQAIWTHPLLLDVKKKESTSDEISDDSESDEDSNDNDPVVYVSSDCENGMNFQLCSFSFHSLFSV